MYRLLNRNRLPFLPPAPHPLSYSSREQALARRMGGEALPLPCYGEGRLGEIVLKAAAYDPGERYQDPAQMRRELEEILDWESDRTIIYPEEAAGQEGNVPAEETTEKIVDPAEEQTLSIFGDGISGENQQGRSSYGSQQNQSSHKEQQEQMIHGNRQEQSSQDGQQKSSGLLVAILLLVVAVAGGILCYIIWKGSRQDPGQTVAGATVPSPSPSVAPVQTPAPSPTRQPEESLAPSVQPEDTVIVVPPIGQNELSVDAIAGNPLVVEQATFLPYSGALSGKGQEDLYTFEAPCNGTYRVDVSGMSGDMEVNLYAYDASGAGFTSASRCSNGQGMTVMGLSAGSTYQIGVKQREEYGSYDMNIGLQKESLDITAYTQLTDSLEYTDQTNVYLFTAPRDGRYRFEFSEMMGYEMTEGETYQIQVHQREGYSSYILSVGQQKETVDISSYTVITDSVEFTEQKNVYLCTVPLDGRYRLELSDMMGGTEVELHVYNERKELVDAEKNCSNGQGLTLKGLTAGETYWVQVRQKNGCSAYTLSIGPQKVTVPVEDGSVVTDSVEYTDQRNVYSFTARQDGDVTFALPEMTAGTMVELYVFNDLGEEAASQKQCYNGGSVTVQGVTEGIHLEVQVRQEEGLGSYRMAIE